MQDDLTISLAPAEPAVIPTVSYEDALKMPRPITFRNSDTGGTLTTISAGIDPTHVDNRPAPGLLRCQGIGTADPATAMGVPAAPIAPVVAPTAAQKLAMDALPIMSHTEALAQPVRPWTFRDSTGAITTIH